MTCYQNDNSLDLKFCSKNVYNIMDENNLENSTSFDLRVSENNNSDSVDADEVTLPQTKISNIIINYFTNHCTHPNYSNPIKSTEGVNQIEQSIQNYSGKPSTPFIGVKVNNLEIKEDDHLKASINTENQVKMEKQISKKSKYGEILSKKIKYNISKIFIEKNNNCKNSNKMKQKITTKQCEDFYNRNIELLKKQNIKLQNKRSLIELESAKEEEIIHNSYFQAPKSRIDLIVERLYKSNARNIGSNYTSLNIELEKGKC